MPSQKPKKESTQLMDSTTASEHITLASEYAAMATDCLFDPNGRPQEWDSYTERAINIATRMAQTHLLMASTKAALKMYDDAAEKSASVEALMQAWPIAAEAAPVSVRLDEPLDHQGDVVEEIKASLARQVRRELNEEGAARIAIPFGRHEYRNAMKVAAEAWSRSNGVDVSTGIEYGAPGTEPTFTATAAAMDPPE
jgi:hypothetical protein